MNLPFGMAPYFLFDIDGTLINVRRSFLRPMLQQLMEELSLNTEILHQLSFAGRTDKAIFSDLTKVAGGSSGLFHSLKQTYLEALHERLQPEQLAVIDHVPHVLEYLHSAGYPLGLLTGNFKEAAMIKMERAGLADYFSFGAFGCDHHDRRELPELAMQSIEKTFGQRVDSEMLIIIGDTPADVDCAKAYGARSIAVATGHYPYSELEAHQPDLLLSNLRNPQEWLQRLGESG